MTFAGGSGSRPALQNGQQHETDIASCDAHRERRAPPPYDEVGQSSACMATAVQTNRGSSPPSGAKVTVQ